MAWFPLEEEALALAEKGDIEGAKSRVYGEEYRNMVQQINSLTDEVIIHIQERVKNAKMGLRIFQGIVEVFYAFSFLYLIFQVAKLVKFSREELLTPIVKVPDQMGELAEGDFHADFEIEEDESEVGFLKISEKIGRYWEPFVRFLHKLTAGLSSCLVPRLIWRKEARSRQGKYQIW